MQTNLQRVPFSGPSLAILSEVVAANFAGVDVTCTSAATQYQAYALNLASIMALNMRLTIEVSYNWLSLTTATKTMTIGYGRTFTKGMTGTTSDPDGRATLVRTNAAAANQSEFRLHLDVGASLDAQHLLMTSNGTENTGTSSTPGRGIVTLSNADCSLYVGIMSANAGDVCRIEGIRITKTLAV